MRDEISQASLGIQNLRKIVEKLKEQNVYSKAGLPDDINDLSKFYICFIIDKKFYFYVFMI